MGIRHDVEQGLEKYEITKIDGQPTDEDLNLLTKELTNAAGSVATQNRGSGGYRTIPFPPFFFPTTHKIEQRKKSEKRDGPRTDHSTISAKPDFNESLPPSPFFKEFDSFYKNVADSGDVTA